MALTRSFKDTVGRRAERDPAFRRALLVEAVNELLTGDADVAKAMLREYINATIAFTELAPTRTARAYIACSGRRGTHDWTAWRVF